MVFEMIHGVTLYTTAHYIAVVWALAELLTELIAVLNRNMSKITVICLKNYPQNTLLS